ncbi:hypothetical protein PENSTE_c023G09063 [Penicillium steckii]|uniref:Uncharacterized protein n=1 Tax=Penicillium steckii TaxID=303698 RepID=A0A1V6SRJ8_9EURO|nr:hypothetical protein PENSTE_c023G09063 [Penicillium steckii]
MVDMKKINTQSIHAHAVYALSEVKQPEVCPLISQHGLPKQRVPEQPSQGPGTKEAHYIARRMRYEEEPDTEPESAPGIAPGHSPTFYPKEMSAFGHKLFQRPRPKFSTDSTIELISILYLMTNVEATDTETAREATLAIEVFKDGHPTFFERHSPVLRNMIWFFIARFDFHIASESLPVHNTFESPELAMLRTQVVCSFIHQYEDMFVRLFSPGVHKSQMRDANLDIFPRAEGVMMIRLGTTILYWYLKDFYVARVGIRQRKDSQTQKRTLEELAKFEIPRRCIKTTIDYRSHFSLEDLGLSLAILANTPVPPPTLERPLVRMDQYENSVIGLDDASIDLNLSSKAQKIPLSLEPRTLSATKIVKDSMRTHLGTGKSQEDPMKMELIKSNQAFNSSTLLQDQIRSQKKFSQIVRQPIERPAELPSLGKVDYLRILDQVIDMANTRYPERYGLFLKTCIKNANADMNLRSKIIGSLNPKVILAFQNGIHDVGDLIEIGGQPDRFDGPGVYLHILWKFDKLFWLYIGQSMVLKARISDHNSICHRTRHPSMHYTVWDFSDGIKSLFVSLASFCKDTWPGVQSQPQVFEGDSKEYMLNILEMWMCCSFQTLGAVHLPFSDSEPKPWAGRHLNIAVPLWQRFSHEPRDFKIDGLDRLDFQEHLHSQDPMIRSWAKDLRDSYNTLRNSPSLQVRSYYFEQQRKAGLIASQGKVQLRRFEKYGILLNNRVLAKAKRTPKGGCSVSFGDFFFTIRNDTGIRPGDEVSIQAFLTEHPHPDRYAQLALATDPASRLLVGLTSSKWEGWLSSDGDKNVFKMNTLVDIFERVPSGESRLFERRWQRATVSVGSKRQTIYT